VTADTIGSNTNTVIINNPDCLSLSDFEQRFVFASETELPSPPFYRQIPEWSQQSSAKFTTSLPPTRVKTSNTEHRISLQYERINHSTGR